MTYLRTAAAAGLMLAVCPAVAAQTAHTDHTDQDHDPRAARDTSFSVGDIVVTARDMAGSSATVLTSVDRLGGDIAQRQSVDNTWELFARLPGVTLTDFNQGTTSGRFSIRGFNGEGEINAVRLSIDGIPANTNDGGMGLGLSVTRSIVESHGSALSVSRPQGGGACFTFRLSRPTEPEIA